MSNHESTARAHDEMSLAELLRSAGVVLADQAEMERKMEATRLGLSTEASSERIERAWLRRALSEQFTIFERATFQLVSYRWGGRMPPMIALVAHTIKVRLPEVDVRIYATPHDPWLVIHRLKERAIIAGWYYQRGVAYLVT